MLPAAPKAPAKGGGFFLKRRRIITAGRTGGLTYGPIKNPLARISGSAVMEEAVPPNFAQTITSRCLMRDSPLRTATCTYECDNIFTFVDHLL